MATTYAIAHYVNASLAEIGEKHEAKLIDAGYVVMRQLTSKGSTYTVLKAGETEPYTVSTDTRDLPTACSCQWFREMHDGQHQSRDGVTIARTEYACKHIYAAFQQYRADKGDPAAAALIHAIQDNYNDYYQHTAA